MQSRMSSLITLYVLGIKRYYFKSDDGRGRGKEEEEMTR